MRWIKTWMEDGRTFVFAYKQEDYQIFDFKVYSDGFPGTRLSDYTALHPLELNTFSEVMEIVPTETLRDICLVEEVEPIA